MREIAAIEVVEDYTARARCDEGFLRLKRLRARNRRVDGSASREYPIDVIDRPTLDAVAVCLYARTSRGVEVLTRRGLRPAAYFRRGKVVASCPSPSTCSSRSSSRACSSRASSGSTRSAAAGADEVREEAGIEVAPDALEPLGGRVLPAPGDRLREDPPPRRRGRGGRRGPTPAPAPQEGDGSPLEEGAVLVWRELGAALAACERGEIEDAKTELALRRLAARLRPR